MLWDIATAGPYSSLKMGSSSSSSDSSSSSSSSSSSNNSNNNKNYNRLLDPMCPALGTRK